MENISDLTDDVLERYYAALLVRRDQLSEYEAPSELLTKTEDLILHAETELEIRKIPRS